MRENNIDTLKKIANDIRVNILKEVYSAKSGHLGGALSCTDILTVLYFNQMNINPEMPKDENRDRFVLSKGHASSALYATLSKRGFFDEKNLAEFRTLNSKLQGHPDMNKILGVDMTTGSLGQGLSAANGMAISGKINKSDYRVYCLLGDGELQEGQVWEAAMTSSHYKLDNLCVIIDNNNLQIDGKVSEVMNVYPIDEKFRSFGFEVINIDGNDISQIIEALEKSKNIKNKPTAIIAKTIKGKGVDFMENNASWHGKSPNDEEYAKALEQLLGG